jgi:hypothetical protein
MVTQATLSAVAYPSHTSSWRSQTRTDDCPDVALRVLTILRSMSFVIAQFGGISPYSGSVFTELRRVVYTALDLLSSDANQSELFLQQCASEDRQVDDIPDVIRESHIAFTLACSEQLVPSLSEKAITETILPLCMPYVTPLLKTISVILTISTQMLKQFKN